MYKLGVHPTIAGVILGLMAPVKSWFGKEGFVMAAQSAIADFQLRAATPNHEYRDLAEVQVTQGREPFQVRVGGQPCQHRRAQPRRPPVVVQEPESQADQAEPRRGHYERRAHRGRAEPSAGKRPPGGAWVASVDLAIEQPVGQHRHGPRKDHCQHDQPKDAAEPRPVDAFASHRRRGHEGSKHRKRHREDAVMELDVGGDLSHGTKR